MQAFFQQLIAEGYKIKQVIFFGLSVQKVGLATS
jgi:hypothetical protein